MESITKKAYAKVNLTLYVTGKLTSGYHTIDSIMQEISLHDTIELKKVENGIKIDCEQWVYNGEDNLAYKAADLMFKKYKIKDGIKIKIYKKIPSAAGLGGGSSDAAAVIKGMNRLYGLGMNEEEMIKMAAKIGMDVPFFILGGTVHATDQGQKVERIKGIPNNIYFVLAKPNFSILTKEAYIAFDYNRTEDELIKQDMLEKINKRMLGAIKSADIKSIAENSHNDFDDLITKNPIPEIKDIMKKSGALNALMSGSGPTVFGITEKGSIAREIYKNLEKENFKFIYITKTGEKY